MGSSSETINWSTTVLVNWSTIQFPSKMMSTGVTALVLMLMAASVNATYPAIANLLGGGGESPYADSDCDCGFTSCQKEDTCSWFSRRQQSINKLGKEGFLELVYEYNDELRASKCNQDKICCPKAFPKGACPPGCSLTYDRAICNI